MRSRVTVLFSSIVFLLSCVFAQAAQAQIHTAREPSSPAKVSPKDSSVSVDLDLCVQGGTNGDTCPPDLQNFMAYVPDITYVYGQVLDGLIYVKPADSIGTITITANGVLFCTLPTQSNIACPAESTNFDAGVYTLYASFNPAGGGPSSQSLPVMITVLQDVTALFKLTSSLNPSPVGSPVTFTTKALGTYGEPATGTITFSEAANTIGTGVIDLNGTASFTTSSLSVGPHAIVASYPGSVDLKAPPDEMLTQVVLPPITVTSISSSLNPSVLGDNVTFTAGVAASSGLQPTGAVSFDDGVTAFATVLVSAQGVAKTSISTLAGGTHNITANYSGDTATGPSASPVLMQQVDFPLTQAVPGFIVTVSPIPVVLGLGLTANLTVTVTPRSGFSQPVTLTCGDLPHESTCGFGQTVIPVGGGSTTLDVHVTSPHDCGSSAPYFYGSNKSGPGPGMRRYGGQALAGVLLLLLPSRRRWQKGLLVLCASLSVVGLSGCSSACTDFGTYPGSYTFQVIGTAPAATSGAPAGSSATLVVPTSVALTVKL